mmetsp:Transcript_57362/g.136346  ORF Transcript_57362/g.136346 Transcript_57362/m.136346 type:complete len:157 (-) Transcript_57362:400-870(-)
MGCKSSTLAVGHGREELRRQKRADSFQLSEASTCLASSTYSMQSRDTLVSMSGQVGTVSHIHTACEDDRSPGDQSQCTFKSMKCVWVDADVLAEEQALAPDYATHQWHVANLDAFLDDVQQSPHRLENRILSLQLACGLCTEEEMCGSPAATLLFL